MPHPLTSKVKITFSSVTTFCLLLLILSTLVLRWQVSVFKPFDPDELAQLHTSWLITHGSLPYKDFFTGYPPTFPLLLSPFLTLLPPSDFVPVLIRQVFFLLFIFSLFALYKVARLALDQNFSLLAVLLLSLSVLSLERGVEIRPDNLLIPLWLMATYAIATSKKTKPLILAGLVTGLAATITQKAVYGTVFVFAVLFLANKIRLSRKTAIFFGSFLIPPIFLLLFALAIGLGPHLYEFLIKYPLNLSQIYQWDHPWYILGFVKGFTSYAYFTYLYKDSFLWLYQTQITSLLALFSLLPLVRHFFKKRSPEPKPFFLILYSGLIIFTVYLLTIHVKLPQYYLFLNPFLCLLTAFGLSELSQLKPLLGKLVLFSLLVLNLLTSLDVSKSWTLDLQKNNNQRQRDDIRAVLTYTSPTARGYDGLGSYIYRKDCFYFGMVIPQEIPKAIFQDIITDLSEGNCDFVVNGLFGRMSHWNLDENAFVSKNFTSAPETPDLLLKNK